MKLEKGERERGFRETSRKRTSLWKVSEKSFLRLGFFSIFPFVILFAPKRFYFDAKKRGVRKKTEEKKTVA